VPLNERRRGPGRPLLLAVLLAAAAATVAIALAVRAPGPGEPPAAGRVLLAERFDRPDGVVADASTDDDVWEVTSGTLLARVGAGWSGEPDDGEGGGTGSAVLRARTRADAFADVRVDLRLLVRRLVTTGRTPATGWDGAHVWLRHRSPQELYVASAFRRDGTVALKKKCDDGGPANGGTYHTLATAARRLPTGEWAEVGATVRDRPDGAVELRLLLSGRVVLEAVDRGAGCPPLRGAGAVGIRADNADLLLDDLTVRSLAR
jgi:hypothetical protein